jgi:HEAT repeat protein
MSPLIESFALDASSPRFIRIVGAGTSLAFERENGWWVANALAALALDPGSPVGWSSRQDSFRACTSGPEQAPLLNLRNERPATAEHGGVVSLTMTATLAQRLAAELEALPFGRATALQPGTVDAAVVAIERGLASADPEEVFDALIDIGKQGRGEFADRVVPHLSSEVEFLREAAIETLVFHLKLPEHEADAIRLRDEDPDEDVRAAAALALRALAG